MKKIARNLKNLALMLLLLFAHKSYTTASKEAQEPEKISETIKEKNKEAEKAKLEAEHAHQAAQRAREEAARYEALSKKYEHTNNTLYEDALKKQREFAADAEKKFDTQKTQEKKAKNLEEEVAALKKDEGKIESGFIEAGSSVDEFVEEKFENCIQDLIAKQLKTSPKTSDSYKKLLLLLSEKLKEIEVYERSTFYKSSSITDTQWEKIRENALKNTGAYDKKYEDLLQSIQQIKYQISKLTNEKNFFIPIPSETHECFVKYYSKMDTKLNALEKDIATENEEDSSPWD